MKNVILYIKQKVNMSLDKCFQIEKTVTLVFSDDVSDVNTISLSSGDIISITSATNSVFVEFDNENRPLIVDGSVKMIDGSDLTFSRMVAREYNYKSFTQYIDLCNYYLNEPDTNLDGKIYYDGVSGNLYYDYLATQFAGDLNDFILVYSVDNFEYLEPINLISGVIEGWKSPRCRDYITEIWSL
jgi:hypothetical protein